MPGEDVKQIVGLDLAGLSCIFLEQDLHLARTRVCDRARERERECGLAPRSLRPARGVLLALLVLQAHDKLLVKLHWRRHLLTISVDFQSCYVSRAWVRCLACASGMEHIPVSTGIESLPQANCNGPAGDESFQVREREREIDK